MASIISAGTTAGTALNFTGDTTGNLAFQTQAGANTITVPNGTGTVAVQGVSSNIVSGTSQASTSGTAINFTGIPSWVKRITVMYSLISTNGSSNILVRLGTGSTSWVSTGYNGVMGQNGSTNANTSSGIGVSYNTGSGNAYNGSTVITNLTGNTWTAITLTSDSTGTGNFLGSSSIALGATLTGVQVTTANGTDTFDAGSINILYE